jgi:hypothetical protein
MAYSAGIYRGQGPRRWAVFCSQSRTWYFPTKTGKRAAEIMAQELNK